jgi:hypothetical protein
MSFVLNENNFAYICMWVLVCLTVYLLHEHSTPQVNISILLNLDRQCCFHEGTLLQVLSQHHKNESVLQKTHALLISERTATANNMNNRLCDAFTKTY